MTDMNGMAPAAGAPNESYEAVMVTPEGSSIGVNIGIDKFYDVMENGRSYDELFSVIYY